MTIQENLLDGDVPDVDMDIDMQERADETGANLRELRKFDVEPDLRLAMIEAIGAGPRRSEVRTCRFAAPFCAPQSHAFSVLGL